MIPISAGIGNMENEIYALDETGKEIWALLDGKRSLNEIIVDLEKCYSASAGTIRRDVLGLIGELAGRGIVLPLHHTDRSAFAQYREQILLPPAALIEIIDQVIGRGCIFRFLAPGDSMAPWIKSGRHSQLGANQ